MPENYYCNAGTKYLTGFMQVVFVSPSETLNIFEFLIGIKEGFTPTMSYDDVSMISRKHYKQSKLFYELFYECYISKHWKYA